MAVDETLAFDIRYSLLLPPFGQLGTDLKEDPNGHHPPSLTHSHTHT